MVVVEEVLASIRTFEGPFDEWFAIVRNDWSKKRGQWNEQQHFDESYGKYVQRYYLETGQENCNEQLIHAMKLNWEMWTKTWELSRKDGFHVFSYTE